MKPSQLQLQKLQNYLRSNLKYRETYAEFYDHILSALEAQSADSNFDDAISRIITADFGGMEGLRLIEDNYQRSVFAEMRRKFFSCTVESLKLPWIFLPVVFGVGIYYMAIQPWFNFIVFLSVFFVMRMVPLILNKIRTWNPAGAGNAPKRSVKAGFYTWQNKIPAAITAVWLIATFDTYGGRPILLAPLNPYVVTGLLTLIALHSLINYRVYIDEIKTSISTR